METTNYITSSNEVFPEVTYTFEVQGTPSGWNVTNYKWEVGPDAQIYINGSAVGLVQAGSNLTSIDVKFYDLCTSSKQHVALFIDTIDPDENVATVEDRIDDLELKAIDDFIITGELQVQECCLNDLYYYASALCDADEFSWTLPAGWGVNQQINSPPPYVKVRPDDQTGGPLQVTASISNHPIPGTYEKTASIQIARPKPQIKITSRPLNPLCPFSSYYITYTPICGAQEYLWDLPQGWTVLEENIGRLDFTPSVGEMPGQEGPIVLEVSFDGCASISSPINLPLITGPPEETPSFYHHGMYTWYHCGKWQICPNRGGRITLDHVPDNKAEEVEYEITGNYHFGNGQQSIIKALPQNTSFATYIPFIDIVPTTSVSPGPGQIRARFKNCLNPGTGPWSAWQDFYQEEEPEWCYDQFPYPDWCPCCEPGEDGNVFPKSALIKIDANNGKDVVFKVYPNPASTVLTVQNITGLSYSYEIFTSANQLITSGKKVTALKNNIDISLLAPGPYYLVLTDAETNETHRFKVLKQ